MPIFRATNSLRSRVDTSYVRTRFQLYLYCGQFCSVLVQTRHVTISSGRAASILVALDSKNKERRNMTKNRFSCHSITRDSFPLKLLSLVEPFAFYVRTRQETRGKLFTAEFNERYHRVPRMTEYPFSSIQRRPFFLISFPYAFHTRLSAKQFEAREEERLLSKETVEKARSFHRERSVVFRFDPRSFILRYPFRESIPRSALPLAISSRDREEEREGNCWQNDSSNGSYGPLVRFNGISPSRAKIWVASATRARARL